MTNFIGMERMGNLRNLTKKFTPMNNKILLERKEYETGLKIVTNFVPKT